VLLQSAVAVLPFHWEVDGYLNISMIVQIADEFAHECIVLQCVVAVCC